MATAKQRLISRLNFVFAAEGWDRRLATCQHGTVFGETSLVEGKPRAASVRARSPVVCFELTHESFERLGSEHPRIGIAIHAMIARTLGERLRNTNALVLELEG